MRKERIPDLVAEIKDELSLLERLIGEIENTVQAIPEEQQERSIYEESLALKLHNFYTAIERIFEKIAGDINGGVPSSYDWHKRLLKTMALKIDGVRPPVISNETARRLQDFLAFRHVVRNIYGFELDPERLKGLIAKSSGTFSSFKGELLFFLDFLHRIYTS